MENAFFYVKTGEWFRIRFEIKSRDSPSERSGSPSPDFIILNFFQITTMGHKPFLVFIG